MSRITRLWAAASLLGLAAGASAQTSASRPQTDKAPSVVGHVRLSGTVLERAPELSLLGDSGYMTLQDWLKRLAEARNDGALAAVALEIEDLDVSWAQAQELAEAIARLDKVKPVHAFLSGPGLSEYLVAAAARELTLSDTDELTLPGLSAELIFFRGALDKLGIAPQFIQIGPYKGAAEPMTRGEPSKELKEQYDWLLDDLFSQLLGQVARARRIPESAARAAIDEAILPADRARELKLIDRLADRADWQQHVRDQAGGGQAVQWVNRYGAKSGEQINWSNPFAVLGAILRGKPQPEIEDPTIVIFNAEGLIVSGAGGEGLFGQSLLGSRTASRYLQLAQDDERVKAVVLRVDSPGGSASASEEIYQAVRRCAAHKPVVVSMGHMAASGGYYISCPATVIYADPASMIGSIGVVGGKLAFSGLLDKLGISSYPITRGRHAGLEGLRPWTDQEMALVRGQAERTYRLFLDHVKAGRGAKIAQVDRVAGGRLFTGRQAKANGLADELGGFREAVIRAQQLAKLDQAHFITYPQPRGLIDLLTAQGDEEQEQVSWKRWASEAGVVPSALSMLPARHRSALAYLLGLAELMGRESVLAAMPCYLGLR